MNEERLYQVLLQPHLTEKSSMGSGLLRQYAFKVDKTATKKEIKAAIEKLFQVSVRSIRTCNVKSNGKSLSTSSTTKSYIDAVKL